MNATERTRDNAAATSRRPEWLRFAGDAVRLAIAAALLVVAVFYFRWTDTPEVRYRKFYNRMYSMIYGETGPVDVALMGTSRAQCMIGANEWARVAFGSQSGAHVVYNLATSQRGKGFHYVVLRDLMEQRPVRRIVLEFDGTDPRPGYYEHPWFYMIARHADIWRSVVDDGGHSWDQRIRDGVQIFMKKHVSLLEDYAVGISFIAPKAAPVPAATKDHLTANPVRPPSLALRLSQRTIESAVSGGESWDFTAPLERRNSNFIRDIAAEAARHGTRLDFMYIPTLMEPPMSAGMTARIGAAFGGRVLQPLPGDLPQFFPAAFADYTHARETGRKIFADLVAPQLQLPGLPQR